MARKKKLKSRLMVASVVAMVVITVLAAFSVQAWMDRSSPMQGGIPMMDQGMAAMHESMRNGKMAMDPQDMMAMHERMHPVGSPPCMMMGQEMDPQGMQAMHEKMHGTDGPQMEGAMMASGLVPQVDQSQNHEAHHG